MNEKNYSSILSEHAKFINDLFDNINKSQPSTMAESSVANNTIGNKLWEINKEIKKLKHQIPSSSKFSEPSADGHDESQRTEGTGTEVEVDGSMSLYIQKANKQVDDQTTRLQLIKIEFFE